MPPPVPPRGTPKVKRGGGSASTSGGKGDGSLHDLLRFPPLGLLHDAMERVGGYVRGRVFGVEGKGCYDPEEEEVRLSYFGRAAPDYLRTDRSGLYFSPATPRIYLDDDYCHIDVEDGI